MKKIKLFPLMLIICLSLTAIAPGALALDDPQPSAQAVVLADMDSGRVIYSKNMNEQRSPASLTKVMTVLVALEALESGQVSMEDMVTAGADCQKGMDTDSSNASIVSGEVMSFKDLLYCAMVASANDACNVIAAHVAGSIDAFVAKMNEKAAALGCTGTTFVDPNGLSSSNLCTAYDLYLITRAALQHDTFVQLCNTVSYQVPATNVNAVRNLANSNALISSDSIYGSGYIYEYAAGVKTGYTRAAGYCLISTAEKDGVQVLAVVLGCGGMLNTGDSEFRNFVDTIDLYDWTFENFAYKEMLTTAYPVQTVQVALAEGDGNAILRPAGNVKLLLPKDVTEDALQLQVTVYEDKLTAPIEAGTVLGQARLVIDGEDYGSIELVTNTDIEMSKAEYLKARLQETFGKTWVKVLIIVVIVIGIGYLALVARYRALRRKYLREKRLQEQRRRRERELRMQRQSVPEPTQRFSTIDPGERGYSGTDYEDIFNEINRK